MISLCVELGPQHYNYLEHYTNAYPTLLDINKEVIHEYKDQFK